MRPPPPKKSDQPSSPTEAGPRTPPPHFPREAQEAAPKPELSPLNRPPPPKPKAFVLPPAPARDREKGEEPARANKVPIPPKPQVKAKKPAPPRDKLPPLIKEAGRDEVYLAVADFEGDEQTAGFKVGAMFEVLEKNGSGWWFCKNLVGEHEGWIPSNYLSKKP